MENNKFIILVDDEPSILNLLRIAIEDIGYKVECFTSGVDAINRYRFCYNDVSLVITDLSMGGVNGYDLIQEIKNINPKVKILLITGLLSDDINFLIDNDVVVLQKPFKKEELNNALKNILEV